jgi:uncharacterized protein YkwD
VKFALSLGVLIAIATGIGATTMVQSKQDPQPESLVESAPAAPNPKSMTKMESLALAAHDRVNQYRESQNLPPLVFDETIAIYAQIHSAQMANTQNMSHDGFKERVEKIGKTIPYRGAAENLAYNQGYDRPDEMAVQGWIASPGHHRNMIGKYNLTGIGVAQNAKGEYYFTQLFIKER